MSPYECICIYIGVTYVFEDMCVCQCTCLFEDTRVFEGPCELLHEVTFQTRLDTVGLEVGGVAKGVGLLHCFNSTVSVDEPIECDVAIRAGSMINISSSTGDVWTIEGIVYTLQSHNPFIIEIRVVGSAAIKT